MLEFSAFDAIIEAGYQHARGEIQAWQNQAEAPRQSGMITLHDTASAHPPVLEAFMTDLGRSLAQKLFFHLCERSRSAR